MTRRSEEARLVAGATGRGEWIAHDGTGPPDIDLETVIDVRHFDGTLSTGSSAEFWCGGLEPWIHAKCEHDEIKIVAYRIVGAV